jgi:cytochrome d ubiquinol oxidase subunit I
VPLTLGLSFLLVIMETTYVLTGKSIYRDMTKFWGKLFGINFALGVTTGITMEFQFGTNWAYYSHYVGDIFGAPLAIEGLMAFFLESTFIGLFFFGWERLSKHKHLMVTVLMAIGSNLSALWILIANGWMQNPVGAEFSYTTMRMELVRHLGRDVQPHRPGQVRAYRVGRLRHRLDVRARHLGLVPAQGPRRRIRAPFLPHRRRFWFCLGPIGDRPGRRIRLHVTESQQSKLAAVEAMWETEPAPAGFNLLAWPNEAKQANDWEIKLPYALGLIATRSTSKTIPGIKDIRAANRVRMASGILAVKALERLRKGDLSAKPEFEAHKADLGYGLLLKKYVADVAQATPEQIDQAAHDTVPHVAPLFWSFRLMVVLGFSFALLFTLSFWYSLKGQFADKKWLLRWAVLFIPMPWVAAEVGWVVAEYGRQPWSIFGVLPTHLSASTLSVNSLYGSLAGFVGFYTLLLIVEMYLMFKFARLGPSSLGTGKYHFERNAA